MLGGLFLSPLSLSSARAESWTNLDGDRTIQAKMIGMWNDQVVLQLNDGRSINVPMDKLIAASRIQAGKIAERLKQDREALTNEIKNAAAIEAASAPDPLPTPPAAPAYQPPVADMAPDEALESIREQFQNGHLVVIYDALPPEYRQKLDGLVRLTLTKLDPNSLAQPLEQLHGLADLVVTRQNWILSEPRLRDHTGGKGDLNATGELIKKFVLPAAGLIRTGLPVDQTGVKKMKEMNFGEWLHQRDDVIAPYAALLLEDYSSPSPQWSVVKTKDETALLEKPGASKARGAGAAGEAASMYGADFPGQNNRSANPTVAFQKVEGFWIPADVAEGFDAWVQEQTDAMEKYNDASMSLSDWLGGQSVAVPSVASTPQPNERRRNSEPNHYDEYEDELDDQYDNPANFDGPADPYESAGAYGEPEGYESFEGAGGRKPSKLEPVAITPAMMGSILQSVGGFQSMCGPLEAATDEASFHTAAEQLIGSIRGLMSLVGT